MNLRRPQVGDELLVCKFPNRYRIKTKIIPVIVVYSGRFKVKVRRSDDVPIPYSWADGFDIRTRRLWKENGGRGFYSNSEELHTEESLIEKIEKKLVHDYLILNGISQFSLRNGLKESAENDLIGFANALRKFEGLEPIKASITDW